MIYSDAIYDSDYWPSWIPKGVDPTLYLKTNPVQVTNQNFDINTWDYTAENVPRLTSGNLAHEWPDSTPFWEYIESAYKNAAKGFSPELAGKSCSRLCKYVTLRARPTYESVCIAQIWQGYWVKENDALYYQHGYINNELTGSPNPFVLTGQFIDMPDGRWHYVFLKDAVYRSTSTFFWKYLRPEAKDDSYREVWKEMYGEEVPEDIMEKGDVNKAYFRFGFVREDLLGIIDLSDNHDTAIIPLGDVLSYYDEYGNSPTDDWYDQKLRDLGIILGLNFYPRHLDNFRPLYPTHLYPGFYEYEFEYYEYPEKGYSYFYNLLPARDLKHLANDSYIALFNEDNPRNRVNAVPNNGDTELLPDIADEIKADQDLDDGAGKNPSVEVGERNVIAGAGVVALGILLLKNNM